LHLVYDTMALVKLFRPALAAILLLCSRLATAAPVKQSAPRLILPLDPTVKISSGTIVGSSFGGVDSFNGIPFAQPPVGPLRLKSPQPLNSSLGTFDATGMAKSCPQMFSSTASNEFVQEVLNNLTDNPLFKQVTEQSEDCLTINVYRPTGATSSSNLPVLFWIFGGGFELGSSSMYNPAQLMVNANARGQPFLFVAVNYRVAGWGFLPGKEILADGSANLGLLDQRLGLQWTADNVAAFGGDPTRVTISGESAGAISVLDQMILYNGNITYKGKPLFRGAIMDSGSIVPADPVDCPKGQAIYDAVVDAGGCSSASDTLECLRGLSYDAFFNAANSVPGILSYNSVALSYLPRPDGTAITDTPDILVQQGKYAAVPMIIGDQEDEGTLFSLFQSNITTTDLLIDYLSEIFFHDATRDQVAGLVATYPSDPSAGSPFRTGAANEIYPQYKRIAAMLGDLAFTLVRRGFLTSTNRVHPEIPSWSYLSSYDYGTPVLGTLHGSDLLQVFYGILPDYASASVQAYYFNFLYNLDPNNYAGLGGVVAPVAAATKFGTWPRWSVAQEMLQFGNAGATLLTDDFRNESYAYILANEASLHV
jgi:carboxylesterase type B